MRNPTHYSARIIRSSDYVVIYRIGSNFIDIYLEDKARGLQPDEIWIFGKPEAPAELRIQKVIATAVFNLPKEKVHQLNADTQEQACKQNSQT